VFSVQLLTDTISLNNPKHIYNSVCHKTANLHQKICYTKSK